MANDTVMVQRRINGTIKNATRYGNGRSVSWVGNIHGSDNHVDGQPFGSALQLHVIPEEDGRSILECIDGTLYELQLKR